VSSRPGPRGGEHGGAVMAPPGRELTLARCESCGRAYPPKEPELTRRIVELLAGAELTATEAALRLRRRRATVELELERLSAAGVVERLPERGEGKGWRARVWHLSSSVPFDVPDRSRTRVAAENDLLPLVPFFVAIGAAGEVQHWRAQIAFLGAAALFLLALLFEIEALARTSAVRRAA